MTTSGGPEGELDDAARLVTNLQRALESHALIGCAQGILMERHGLDAEAAMALLKQVSMDRNVKVWTIAKVVIAGTFDPAADPPVAPRPRPRGSSTLAPCPAHSSSRSPAAPTTRSAATRA